MSLSPQLKGFKYCYLAVIILFNIIYSFTLSLRARVDLGAMAIKRYSAFPNAPALLEPHHQIV